MPKTTLDFLELVDGEALKRRAARLERVAATCRDARRRGVPWGEAVANVEGVSRGRVTKLVSEAREFGLLEEVEAPCQCGRMGVLTNWDWRYGACEECLSKGQSIRIELGLED